MHINKQELIKEMISVTMLSGYMYCKRKLYLEYVLRIVEPPKDSLVKGSIRHQATDKANKQEKQIITTIKEEDGQTEILDKYVKEYSKILRETIHKNGENLRKVRLTLIDAYNQAWRHFKNQAELRAENVSKFKKETGLSGQELWQKLTPKIKSEIRIESQKLGLKGIIDVLEVFRDNLVPLELKTGKAPQEGVWPGHKIQLAAYMLLLSEKYSTNIKEGFIEYLDTKEKREIIMNPLLAEEVIQTTTEVKELLKNKQIPEICDNENKCAACGLKQQCYDNELLNQRTQLLNRTTP